MKSQRLSRKLHWLSWQPTPYNDYLFRHLASDPDIELTVHYRDRVLSSHPWQSKLGEGYPKRFYKTHAGIDWYVVSRAFANRDATFLIAGWDHPTSQLLLTLLRMLGRNFIIWTDTPNLARRRPPLLGMLRQRWLRWIFSGASRLFGTGQPGVRNLKAMAARADKLVNFPFCVDLQAYAPAAAVTRQHRPLRFISSGRLKNDLKGHDIAIRALAAARHEYQVAFEYYIAGTGPDESVLKSLAVELGLQEQVKFMGWMEPETLRALYLQCDVLIHPSPVHDPFPNAVLEGMAAGLAVLGSDVSGSVVDRVEDGLTGYVHPAGDVAVLAQQIKLLFSDINAVVQLGQRARYVAEAWPVDRALNIIKEAMQIASRPANQPTLLGS